MDEPIGWMRALVIDADDHEGLADFWRALLGTEVAERQEGWVQLTPDPGGVYLAFQPIEPDAEARPRMRARPDIKVADVAAARARIIELGGADVRTVHEPDGDTHLGHGRSRGKRVLHPPTAAPGASS